MEMHKVSLKVDQPSASYRFEKDWDLRLGRRQFPYQKECYRRYYTSSASGPQSTGHRFPTKPEPQGYEKPS
jgi:hypothetical protein